MADGDNVLPFPTTQGFSRTSGLGSPLLGAVGGTSVAVDMGELAVETGVDDNGAPIVRITAPAVHTRSDDDQAFDANLADGAADGLLASIADEVLQGVEADIQSRADLISQYNAGIDLLGQRIEEISASQGQHRGVSRVGNPTLIEAMVKYRGGAEAELLPAAGPVKVATTGRVPPDEERRAQDFADTFNYFLTEIATEYYPDTAQMLMHQAYCGNGFKKIYRCPRRNRPVSESVRMIDLIISEEATDLDTALRVTHQFFPTRSQVKRMQILGKYRDFQLPYATLSRGPAELAIKRSEGLAPQALRPQDMPLHLYECDLELDPDFFPIAGKYESEAIEGLPLPYKVTVERDTRQVMGIWRNWDDGDELYRKSNMYVRFGFVPGLGFHHWGFLQLLGNQTRALRAIWRLLIDNGMFGNFPGGVKIKGARTSTNEIAPGPGEWVEIDVPGATDIRQVLMAMPYKQLDAVFVQFAEMVQQSAKELGGTVEIEVGEGRTNAPVGTVMSMIEQQTQMMAAVHKSNHRAQKEEFLKLRKLFAKNPEDLWMLNPDPPRRWETADEFMDLNLLPASDPNVPSQIARIMQITALLTIVQQTPGVWDVQEVLRRALNVMRIGDPQTLLLTPEQIAANQPGPPPPPPPDPAKIAAAQAKLQQVQLQHEGKMAELQQTSQQRQAEMAQDAQEKQGEHQARMGEAAQDAAAQRSELQTKAQAAALESADRQADRQAQLQEAAIKAQVDREKIAADYAKAQLPPPMPQGGTATLMP